MGVYLGAFGVFVLGLGAWAVARRRKFVRSLQQRIAKLVTECHSQQVRKQQSAQINYEKVPACVRDFLQHAVASQPMQMATVRQRVQIRFDRGSPWFSMSATQRACIQSPSFVYIGSVMLPLGPLKLPCMGYESLVDGAGRMEWRLLGIIPLSCNEGGNINQGGKTRWLAEAIQFPWALRPSTWLTWEAIPGESNQAKVVLRESNDTVSGIYTFDPQTHDIVGFKSEDYARSCATGIERCAMVGYCSGHKPVRQDPMEKAVSIPMHFEGCFVEKDGMEWPYVKVDVEEIFFD